MCLFLLFPVLKEEIIMDITLLVQVVAAGFLIWGLFNENLLARWEKRLFKRLKPVRRGQSRQKSSYTRTISKPRRFWSRA